MAVSSRHQQYRKREVSSLTLAFALSIWLHVGFFSLAMFSETFRNLLFSPSSGSKRPTKEQREKAELTEKDKPLVMNIVNLPTGRFIEVNPEAISAVAPETAKFYASQNSIAANPEVTESKPDPKLEGSQKEVPILKEAKIPAPIEPVELEAPPEKKEEPVQLAKKPNQSEETEERKPRPVEIPGDTLRLQPKNPAPIERKTEGSDPDKKEIRQRPRTVAEARLQRGLLVGNRMKQDGGVQIQSSSSVDAKASPLGDYDGEMGAAIQKHWHDLLDRANYARDRSGTVVIKFKLHQDGRISDVEILDNSAGDFLGTLCELALRNPAPFRPWTKEMRQMLGQRHRELTIRFFYQ